MTVLLRLLRTGGARLLRALADRLDPSLPLLSPTMTVTGLPSTPSWTAAAPGHTTLTWRSSASFAPRG